jgi:hypothetical protein
MEIELNLPPQFYEMLHRLEAFDQKLDRLVEQFNAAPRPVSEPEPPPVPKQPVPAKRRRKAVWTLPEEVTSDVNGANAAGGEEDEDALRARVEFEGKRVQRMFGVGAMRAAVKRVAGDGVLRIDDVPLPQLGELLTALQAL